MAPDASFTPSQPAPASLASADSASAYHQSAAKLQKNPLERTWRGNKAGTLRLQSVPDFGEDLLAKRQWIKVSAPREGGAGGRGAGQIGRLRGRG